MDPEDQKYILVWKPYRSNVEIIGNVASLGICYQGVFLLVLFVNIWLQVMASPSSHTGDTTPIYPYYIHYSVLLAPIRSHKVITLPGPQSGHRHPHLTSIPTKYPESTQDSTKLPQHTSDLSQIYSTGVGPGSIISSRRHSSHSGAVIGINWSEPQTNISNRRQVPNNLHQVSSTSLARLQYYAQLSPTETAVAQFSSTAAATQWNIVNWCQGFWTRHRQPLKAVWNIVFLFSSDTLVRGFPHHYELLTDLDFLNPVWLALSF